MYRLRGSLLACLLVATDSFSMTTDCTGYGDPTAAVPFCFSGSYAGESVFLMIKSFANESGTFDAYGTGVESIRCSGRTFTKTGQTLDADLANCGFTWQLQSVNYCSDQDQVAVTVTADVGTSLDIPMPSVSCW